MAKFNPDVPDTQDPNYLGYSHSIEQPKPNMTLAETFKGIGDTFKSAISAADTIAKEKVEQELRTGITAEQDKFIGKLETTTKNSVLTLEKGESLPPEVDSFGDRAGSLQESFISGKYNPMEYRANLFKLLKTVRSNNPGYVDYIDKKASEITGFNIANAYMSSQLSALNSAASSAQQEYNKTLSYIKDNIGIVGPEMLDNFEKGLVDRVTVLRTIAERKAQYEEWHYAGQKLQNDKNTLDSKKLTATDSLNRRIPQLINNVNEDVMTAAGYNGKLISDLIQGHMDGTKPLDPTTVVALGQRYAALGPIIYKKAYDEAVKAGHVAILGPEVVNKMIKEGMTGFYETARLISKENYTAAGYMSDYSRAITDKDSMNVLLHKDMGPVVREHKALEGILGTSLYQKFIDQRLKDDPQFPEKIKKYQIDSAVGAIVQPNFQVDGTPNTVTKDLGKLPAAGISKTGPHSSLEGKTVSGVLKTVDTISDKSMPEPARANVAKHWAFDPTNFGLLDKFDMEQLNPQTGRMKPGALSVWDKFTRKETAASVFQMARKDPEIAARYIDWVQDGFANSLFRRSLTDLKGIQLDKGTVVSWDPDKLQLKIEAAGSVVPTRTPMKSEVGSIYGTSTPNVSSTQLDSSKQTIANLNRGLAGLKNVIEASGSRSIDPNAYVLSLLANKFADITKVPGVPKAFLDAVVTAGNPPPEPPQKGSPAPTNARTAPKTDTSTPSIPHFAPTEKTPTLQDWLNDPTNQKNIRKTWNMSDEQELSFTLGPRQDLPPLPKKKKQ